MMRRKRITAYIMAIVILFTNMSAMGSHNVLWRNSKTIGTFNNIVLFISFPDAGFINDMTYYENAFNSLSRASVRHFYDDVSCGKLDLVSYFPGQPPDGEIIPYVAPHPEAYYYYQFGEDGQYSHDVINTYYAKERLLSANALKYYEPYIEELADGLDGTIDGITFVTSPKGARVLHAGPFSLLEEEGFPTFNDTLRELAFYEDHTGIWTNFIIDTSSHYEFLRIARHEIGHMMGGFPDLYDRTPHGMAATGRYDFMGFAGYMLAFLREAAGWVDIPLITESGDYTLKPWTENAGFAYRINSPHSLDEYFVVEYVTYVDDYFQPISPGYYEDGTLATPAKQEQEGLIVYRINPRGNNISAFLIHENMLYVLRPGVTKSNPAGEWYLTALAADYKRTEMGRDTDPALVLSNGRFGGITVSDVGELGDTISFRVEIHDPEPCPDCGEIYCVCPPPVPERCPDCLEYDCVCPDPIDPPSDASGYLVPAKRNRAYLDLAYERLTVPQGFSIAAFSTDGRKWKAGQPDIPKLLNNKKGLNLRLTDEYDPKRKGPSADAEEIIFPYISGRPKANQQRLRPGYSQRADLTGETLGAWVLASRGAGEAVTEGLEIVFSGNGKTPDGAWRPMPEDGVPVLSFGSPKATYFARAAPVAEAGRYIPFSKPFRVRPAASGKAPNCRIKDDAVKLRAGDVYRHNGEASVRVSAPRSLNVSEMTGTLSVWKGETVKKPRSEKTVFELPG